MGVGHFIPATEASKAILILSENEHTFYVMIFNKNSTTTWYHKRLLLAYE